MKTETGQQTPQPLALSPEVLSRIQNLELMARLAVNGYLAGRHRSVKRGYGGEFVQYRAYVPGDDMKYVDWKLYARQERICLKVFQEETDMKVALVVDASASMAYRGSRACCSKYRYAAMTAACLAWLARSRGDEAGLFIYGGAGVERSLGGGTGGGLSRQLAALAACEPQGAGNLETALAAAGEWLGERGLLVVLSDLHGDEESLRGLLRRQTCGRRDCIVFQVLDDDELDLPFGESVRFVDSENGQEVAASANLIREEYAADMKAFVKGVCEDGLESRTDVVQVRTSAELGELLTAYLNRRR